MPCLNSKKDLKLTRDNHRQEPNKNLRLLLLWELSRQSLTLCKRRMLHWRGN
jgi:hypothetical protein